MDLALQRRRLFTAMTVTVVALVAAMVFALALFGFHLGWALWGFIAAIVVGFGSHVWLMLGVLREKTAT